MTTGVWH